MNEASEANVIREITERRIDNDVVQDYVVYEINGCISKHKFECEVDAINDTTINYLKERGYKVEPVKYKISW